MGNDGAFINETLIQYCTDRGIEFTRSRAYRSNDQAWIEPKNGSVVRRFVGHDRYSGQVAGQTMAHLYEALRRYVNFFQPSFKLIDKIRDGATTVKHYSQPTTPGDRLIQHDATRDEMKDALKEYQARLDPVLLLHTIREAQSALVAATAPGVRETPTGESLESVPRQVAEAVAPGRGATYSRSESKRSAALADARRSLRGCLGRRAYVVAGRAGCHGQGADGQVAIGMPGPVHRGTVANHATPGEGVARHHGQKLVYAGTDEASAASSGLPELALIGADSKC